MKYKFLKASNFLLKSSPYPHEFEIVEFALIISLSFALKEKYELE